MASEKKSIIGSLSKRTFQGNAVVKSEKAWDSRHRTDEPTRAELKEMLVDTQISIQSILRENKETRREVVQLKESVLEQKTTIASLKTTVVGLEKQCANSEKDLAAARKIIDEQCEEIAELYSLQEQLEQYTPKNSLEIHRVLESAYRSTEEVVLKLAEALEVPVQSRDVEISHKLPSKGMKAIIVKLVSHKVKTQLYKERIKLKNVNIEREPYIIQKKDRQPCK